MKKHLSIILILLISFVLFGCEDLEKKNVVKKEFKKSLPNVEYVGIDVEEEQQVVYRFKNDDFEFTVTNKLEKAEPFNAYSSAIYSDYFLELFHFLEDDIEKLCNKYNIEFYPTYDKDYSEKYNAIKGFKKTTFLVNDTYSNSNEIDYSFYVENGEDIENVFDFLEELESIVKEYYPKKENKLWETTKEISINTNREISKDGHNISLYISRSSFFSEWEHSYDDMEKNTMHNYVNLIEENEIFDDGTQVE